MIDRVNGSFRPLAATSVILAHIKLGWSKGRMTEFVYSAWFADDAAHPDDQDREWVACIGIEAASPEEAQGWGNHLSRERDVVRLASVQALTYRTAQ